MQLANTQNIPLPLAIYINLDTLCQGIDVRTIVVQEEPKVLTLMRKKSMNKNPRYKLK